MTPRKAYKGIHSSWMESAAFDWRDASPLGNGTLGAMQFGGLAHERILFNHERYFGGASSPELPESSHLLAEVRRLLEAGDFGTANDVYRHAWRELGYLADSAHYIPGPVLNIRREIPGAFRNYRRWLDFSKGVAGVDWQLDSHHFQRTAFVSSADACFVLNPCEEGGAPAEMMLWFTPQDLAEAIDHTDRQQPLNIRQTTTFGPNWLASRFDGPDEVSCTVIAHWGDLECSRVGGHTVRVTPKPGCRIVANMLISPTPEQLKAETDRLADLVARTDLQARHEAIHSERYGRCVLDLDVESSDLSNDELLMKAYRGDVPDALLARLANFGRYLLISSANKGTLPPNLQGIWNGNYLPPWWCTFFFNENLQMAIWPALPGGLPECVEGVFDLLEERMDDFRTNAKNMFACRGILPPLYMSPECGLKKNLQAHVQFWTGSGAWLAQIYFDYWLHTGDREFLAKRAIPFMREVAWFYEDFLVEGQDGLLHNYPGNSPENHPLGHVTAKGHPARICVDATMDFALLREVLGNLIEAVRLVEGGDSEDTKRWQGMLQKLPPYRINEDGAIAEWVDPRQKDNYHHRHLSHLYPLFPGFEITPDNTELFEACRVAVEKRLVVGLVDQTGWSLSHMAHIYSRLGKPGRALQSLQLLCRSVVGVNLFTAHNDLRDMGITMDYRKGPRPLVQTEANNGITSAVYEMLALSTPGTLRLLPALPWSWRHGSLKGMRLRGGGILDLEWDRTEGWWRARFTGENRRVLFGNDRGKSLELQTETVQTAEGAVHKLEGVFHESAFAAAT